MACKRPKQARQYARGGMVDDMGGQVDDMGGQVNNLGGPTGVPDPDRYMSEARNMRNVQKYIKANTPESAAAPSPAAAALAKFQAEQQAAEAQPVPAPAAQSYAVPNAAQPRSQKTTYPSTLSMPGLQPSGAGSLNLNTLDLPGLMGQSPMQQGVGYAQGGNVADYRPGGPVSGGPPGTDTVPAMLDNGEYVLPPETANAMGGKPQLDQAVMKTTGVPPVGYANGGSQQQPAPPQPTKFEALVQAMTGKPPMAAQPAVQGYAVGGEAGHVNPNTVQWDIPSRTTTQVSPSPAPNSSPAPVPNADAQRILEARGRANALKNILDIKKQEQIAAVEPVNQGKTDAQVRRAGRGVLQGRANQAVIDRMAEVDAGRGIMTSNQKPAIPHLPKNPNPDDYPRGSVERRAAAGQQKYGPQHKGIVEAQSNRINNESWRRAGDAAKVSPPGQSEVEKRKATDARLKQEADLRAREAAQKPVNDRAQAQQKEWEAKQKAKQEKRAKAGAKKSEKAYRKAQAQETKRNPRPPKPPTPPKPRVPGSALRGLGRLAMKASGVGSVIESAAPSELGDGTVGAAMIDMPDDQLKEFVGAESFGFYKGARDEARENQGLPPMLTEKQQAFVSGSASDPRYSGSPATTGEAAKPPVPPGEEGPVQPPAGGAVQPPGKGPEKPPADPKPDPMMEGKDFANVPGARRQGMPPGFGKTGDPGQTLYSDPKGNYMKYEGPAAPGRRMGSGVNRMFDKETMDAANANMRAGGGGGSFSVVGGAPHGVSEADYNKMTTAEKSAAKVKSLNDQTAAIRELRNANRFANGQAPVGGWNAYNAQIEGQQDLAKSQMESQAAANLSNLEFNQDLKKTAHEEAAKMQGKIGAAQAQAALDQDAELVGALTNVLPQDDGGWSMNVALNAANDLPPGTPLAQRMEYGSRVAKMVGPYEALMERTLANLDSGWSLMNAKEPNPLDIQSAIQREIDQIKSGAMGGAPLPPGATAPVAGPPAAP